MKRTISEGFKPYLLPTSLPILFMMTFLNITQSHATTHTSRFGNTPVNSQSLAMNSLDSSTGTMTTDTLSVEIELPELGSDGSRFIESNKHQALGKWSIQRINGSAPLLADPWSQEILERLAWQINSQARTKAPLALAVINNASINAFAIPGGVMGIHTGTIIEAHSMDEVASVVAHEVAHLSQRHYEHRGNNDKKAMMMQIGGMLAALAASAADGDAAAAIIMGSQTAALNSQMAFSRSNEREADRMGMQLMAKSGYDPRAMPRFFATLNQKMQLNMSDQVYLPSFIMSHPLSSERLSEAQSRANNYDVVGLDKQHSQIEFDLLNWRLKVLTKRVGETDLLAAASRSTGAKLALAYWYGTQGNYVKANQIFETVRTSRVMGNTEVDLLSAITESQVAGMQGKWTQAETVLTPYSRLYPERRDIKLYLSNTLLQQGNYQEVMTLLKPVVEKRPHDIEALRHLQHAYELMATQNDAEGAKIATIHTLRYRSQAEMWQARYNDALISLQQAKSITESITDAQSDASRNATNSTKTNSTRFNTRPLIALLERDIATVKTARDFEP